MEVMKAAPERGRLHGDVLHLEVGQPATPAPAGARRVVAEALETRRLGYSDAWGVPELRERVAAHYPETYGVEVDPGSVIVTTGAPAGFLLAMLACFDAGDRVGITEPGYAAYRNVIAALGLELVGVRVGPETRYVLTVDTLEAAGPLAGMVVAGPSNPTGTTPTAAELESLIVHRSGITLVSDEIYHGITYGPPAPTATGRAVVVQSFSKYQSMTGWRVDWLVVPSELVRPVERLAQNLYISPPAVSQVAALASFDCRTELEANVARYAASRRVFVDGLAAAGIDRIAPPDGPSKCGPTSLISAPKHRAVPPLARRYRGGGDTRSRLRPRAGSAFRPAALLGADRRRRRGGGTDRSLGGLTGGGRRRPVRGPFQARSVGSKVPVGMVDRGALAPHLHGTFGGQRRRVRDGGRARTRRPRSGPRVDQGVRRRTAARGEAA
jgi:aspartate/methionine/tyrosine aminotransferase